MKPSTKSALILLAGLIVMGIGVSSMFVSQDEAIIIGSKSDNSSFFYLVFGALLAIMGIAGLRRSK